ncbi:hypothetical protein N7481_007716 [Penicillium waksmanii]|uniref:uncharacterized protein n=1 Tax=Penicillium waksmanii TaxID=69791 RepID=UPI0025482D29|nr:uncharacterized protein N7481_007716 [Penicillium waksmanii]KAJ5980418.1 hypothetical protein N7481_007716 [Penicillium waksmanii]
MDLRTIMNTDGGASNRQAAIQSSSSPIEVDPSHQQRAQIPVTDYPNRPPPAQHHPSHASPERAASYSGPVHSSPYQQFNAGPPPLNTAIPPQQTQSPSSVSTPYGLGARDQYGASVYNSHPQHPAGPLASPYTPQPMSAGPHIPPEQQSYFAQQRSHSLHSVMTNPRAPAETFPNQENFPSAAPQPPPPHQHQFSPSAHRSVPGTPLGPPPNLASRQSPSSARPQSSGQDSHNPLSSPRQIQDPQIRDLSRTHSPSAQRHFSPGSRASESAPQPHPGVKQESVEHTTPRAVSRRNSTAAPSDATGAVPTRSSEERKWNESPSTPFGSGPGSDARVSPIATVHSQMNSSPSGQRSGSHPLKMEVDHEPTFRVSSQPPKAKRRRYNEPPIYAQRSARTKGKCPVIPSPRPPVPKHARQSLQESWAAGRRSSTTGPPPPSATPSRITRAPGAAAAPVPDGPPLPPTPVQPASRSPAQEGALGIWEPSITGFIPHEEITHELCDFLFRHVVARNDVSTGPAGAAATGAGAIIEVEAKLGHIIDQDRRERLVLPIKTEAIISKETAGFRTSFESNMTVEQHRAYNNFLNQTVKDSMTPPRIQLSYAHKKERDTFYEVSPEELPPVIRSNLNPRHKPKVRVTTDQRTGEVLAKIIKCRVADMDIYSPRTAFDWRVSVNLEMEYEGDIRNLPVVDASSGRGERNKDRMSYRHQAYQVDLTQVARAESAMKNEFDHELEVEISGAELKRQGQLAAAGDPKNQYEELVKGFVDNVRVLARVKS